MTVFCLFLMTIFPFLPGNVQAKKCLGDQHVAFIYFSGFQIPFIEGLPAPDRLIGTERLGTSFNVQQCVTACRENPDCGLFSFNLEHLLCRFFRDPFSQGTSYVSTNKFNGWSWLEKEPNSAVFLKVCKSYKQGDSNCSRMFAYFAEFGIFQKLSPSSPAFSSIESSKVPDLDSCTAKCDNSLSAFSSISYVKSDPCRSFTYNAETGICSLYPFTRRTNSAEFYEPVASLGASPSADESVYFEFECTNGEDRPRIGCAFVPVWSKLSRPLALRRIESLSSRIECEKFCAESSDFLCRSYFYSDVDSICVLSSDDAKSAALRRSKPNAAADPPDQYLLYERQQCIDAHVSCNGSAMSINFTASRPFNGVVFARDAPDCRLDVEKLKQFQMTISLATENVGACEVKQKTNGTFATILVVRHNRAIVTSYDRTFEAMCSFGDPSLTVEYVELRVEGSAPIANSTQRSSFWETVVSTSPLHLGSDKNNTSTSTLSSPTTKSTTTITTTESSTTVTSTTVTSSTTTVATTSTTVAAVDEELPQASLRISNSLGEAVTAAEVGQKLYAEVLLKESANSSRKGAFVTDCAAVGADGQTFPLVDKNGCPFDEDLFEGFRTITEDNVNIPADGTVKVRSRAVLRATFKGIEFQQNRRLNINCNVNFCDKICVPVPCTSKNGLTFSGYGRRRRRRVVARVSINCSINVFLEPDQPDKPVLAQLNRNCGNGQIVMLQTLSNEEFMLMKTVLIILFVVIAVMFVLSFKNHVAFFLPR